jgi:hypothetical protein
LATLFVSDAATSPAISDQDDPTTADWINGHIETGKWQTLPGNLSSWGQPPGEGPQDPYIYEYRLACLAGDDAIFPECAGKLPQCKAAKGGVAVWWYRALRTTDPPRWRFDSGPTCIYSEKPRDVLAEIAAQIGHEFQKSPIQPATVGSQPGPHTLRGQETNFYADAKVQEFNPTLLGQKVHITATPATYTWNYGDGTLWGPTISAGAPLPDDRIGEQTKTSHVYTATGHYAITVTTHFNGVYSVNGGPSLPIPGQGNIQSAPLPLTVWRAVTKNYADNCNQNPDGVGC